MADTTTTPLMLLIVPVPGERLGPTWSEDLVEIFDRIDSHDHTDDSGAKITPGAFDMTADLSFTDSDGNARKATDIRGVQFESLAAALAGVAEYSTLHQVGAELYFLDGNGNAVQLTSNGSVAGAAGSITGMAGGAAVTYSNLGKVFVFTQSAGFPADVDGGSVIVREKVAGGKGVTIKAATGLAADFDFIFPAALPAAGKTQMLTINDAGQVGDSASPTINARPTYEGINPGDTADVTAGNVRYHAGELQAYVGGFWRTLTGAGTKVGEAFSQSFASESINPNVVIPHDNSVPQQTEGTEVLTLAYTAKRAGNLIRVRAKIPCVAVSAVAPARILTAALFRDAALDAVAADQSLVTAINDPTSLEIEWEEVAADTAAHTFKLRLGAHSGTVGLTLYAGWDGVASLGDTVESYSIFIEEIAQ